MMMMMMMMMMIVASPSRRDAGFTIRPNDGKNQSLYFINFITK